MHHGDGHWSSLAAGKQTAFQLGGEVPEDWVGREVDVILRPSLDSAVHTVDCFDIWGKETVFENVTIEIAE